MSDGASQRPAADAAQLRGLLDEIMADPSAVDRLPEADLAKLEPYVGPYGFAVRDEDAAPDSHLVFGFTNLREDYMKKLLTTALIGYIYRRLDEYDRPYKDRPTYMDDMAAAEAEVIANQPKLKALGATIIARLRERDELAAKVAADTVTEAANRKKYDETKTMMTKEQILEMREFMHVLVANGDKLRLMNKEIDRLEEERAGLQAFGKRFIIRQFLDEQFKFNPDKHVRSSYVSRAAEAKAGGGSTNAPTTYAAAFVPPDDTLHNFTYYLDSNYEELIGVTDHLYKTRSDLEIALQAHGVFPTKKEAQKFIDTNQNKVAHDLRSAALGSWAVLPAYKKNRDAILIGQGTIVADILAQQEVDARTGAALARARVTKARTAGIKAAGAPPKQVADYMSDRGAPDPTAIDTKIPVDEQQRIYEAHQEEKKKYEGALVAAAGEPPETKTAEPVAPGAPPTDRPEPEEPAPHDTLRVNVYTMLDGGAETKKSHFLIPAEAPDGAKLPVIRNA